MTFPYKFCRFYFRPKVDFESKRPVSYLLWYNYLFNNMINIFIN